MEERNKPMLKRILHGNLVIKTRGSHQGYILMNLRSFRREAISVEQFNLLCQVKENQDSGHCPNKSAQRLYDTLLEKKQILTEEQCRQYDEARLVDYKNSVENFAPIINLVTISPTFSCNFNCSYCYQREYKDKTYHMTRADIDQICEFINFINGTQHASQGVKAVSLNGGECCQPQNVDVINYILDIFSTNPSCAFSLYTNGSKINLLKDKIDFSRFYSVQVSLDGYEELFPLINGVSSKVFHSVISGIKLLAEKCKSVQIACMLTPLVIEHMDEFVEVLKNNGILDYPNISVGFSVISNFKKETIDRRFLSLEEYIQVRKQFQAAQYPKNVHIDPLREVRQITRHLLREKARSVEREHACNTEDARSAMFAPGGKVYWCLCSNQESEEIGFYTHPTLEAKDKYMQYLYRSPNNMDGCKNCDLKYVCRGGCPIFATAQGKKPSEGYCGLYADSYFWDNLEELL